MKKIFLILLLVVYNSCLQAQNVTKFLGIPVDGSKAEMISKLKAKGFVYHSENDNLSGQFNDSDVYISIQTNNNKVSRILVMDAHPSTEETIRIRYNRLCSQFENNKKYINATREDNTIPNDEDISYQINVNSKTYNALYFQTEMTEEEIQAEILEKFKSRLTPNLTEEEKNKIIEEAAAYAGKFTEEMFLRPVWFRITENFGSYYICLYYDNERNRSNGSDL